MHTHCNQLFISTLRRRMKSYLFAYQSKTMTHANSVSCGSFQRLCNIHLKEKLQCRQRSSSSNRPGYKNVAGFHFLQALWMPCKLAKFNRLALKWFSAKVQIKKPSGDKMMFCCLFLLTTIVNIC